MNRLKSIDKAAISKALFRDNTDSVQDHFHDSDLINYEGTSYYSNL